MATINVYLNFDGNCFEAFEFYRSAFGGEFQYVGRYHEMPPTDGLPQLDPEDGNLIMHISLPIGHETVLMGSDTGGPWAQPVVIGNNFSISANVSDNAEADRLFAALSEGGMVTMPMEATFWGAYFGMLTDKFGVNWMVSVEDNPGK